MHPTFLDSMSWEMAEVYGAITDQILINLARHFPFYDAGDPLPKSAFEYQASKLAEIGQVSKETVQIIRNGLEDADLALKGVLEQAIIDAVKTSEPDLLEAVKKGIFSPATIPVVAPNQMRAFNLYYQQAAQKLNLVNTVMLESTKSAYQQTITGIVADIDLADRISRTQSALDVAAGETITGVSSWNQALRHATDRLKEGGVVGFIDHAGHQWSAEAYVAMDVRTTVFNTGRAATWEMNQNFGNDLYLVSWHSGARPLCYDWQNKVISSTNNARTVVDLDGNEIRVYAQSETTYGEPAGLFGINCKHYPTPFIPGVSVADGTPQDKEENDRVYAESQEQRRLERKLREEKRNLMMAKAQGASTDELNQLRDKCRKSSQDIDDFCKSTGRARHRDREAVYTKREFPDKNRYDVTQFEQDQKKAIDKYFSKENGVQKDYTFDQMTPNEPIASQINEVSTNVDQFRTAAVGAQNKVEFWMNFTEEQQAAFQASGLSIDDLFNMVKNDTPVSEWKAPNPGGVETFGIKHDFSKHGIGFEEVVPRSDGWMADANNMGVIRVRQGGLGDDWDFVISHEAGHQLANASPELQRIILENPGNILGRYNTRLMAFDGIYGEYNPEEAFATAVSVFTRQPEAMQQRYPEAYEAIKTLFDSSPSAREYVDNVRNAYKKRFGK